MDVGVEVAVQDGVVPVPTDEHVYGVQTGGLVLSRLSLNGRWRTSLR